MFVVDYPRFHDGDAAREWLKPIFVARKSRLYIKVGEKFVRHQSVCHRAKEYVRDDVHTNTIEGYFSVFKRGKRGIYQHCGEAHLHRYLSEFGFRYNTRTKLAFTDAMRTVIALEGIRRKRLTYRRAD